MSLRYKIASKLSHWAGRLHPDFDFRVMGWSFTFEPNQGLVWHSGYFGKGTQVLYQQSQYKKAHDDTGKPCYCTDCLVRQAKEDETLAMLQRRSATLRAGAELYLKTEKPTYKPGMRVEWTDDRALTWQDRVIEVKDGMLILDHIDPDNEGCFIAITPEQATYLG